MITGILRTAALVIVAIALALAVVVDANRIGWERENTGFIVIIRAQDVTNFSLDELANIGITGVAVYSSSLTDGGSPLVEKILGHNLEVGLILDKSIAKLAHNFSFLWIESPIDEQSFHKLFPDETTIILREFTDVSQERELWRNGHDHLVRAHEVPTEDMARSSIETLVARFGRAVKERGIRCLMLSPVPGLSVYENLNYFQAVIKQIEEEGYTLGGLSLPFSKTPWYTEIVLHLGVSALLLLVTLQVFRHLPFACFVFSGAVAAIAASMPEILLRQTDAFLIAILVPAYMSFLLVPCLKSGWRAGAIVLLLFSAGSVCGGLLLAAVLSHPVFLLKLAEFRGVKVALLFPSLFGVFVYYRHVGWEKLRSLFYSPIRLVSLTLASFSLAILAFAILRSGNTSGGSLGLEGQVRGILEKLLIARPRFKEFLIGHPFLILFGADGKLNDWRIFPLFVGLIGQASILNTFAHAHTPLLVSLLRVANGLVLGVLAGGALLAVISLGRLLWQRVSQS